jgi:hypothetical protein
MSDDKNLNVSADKYTKEKLGLSDSVSKQDAERIKRETEASKEFHSVMEKDRLLVKRKLRD